MPGAIEIEGRLEKGKVSETFKKLIERHEALRTSFDSMEGSIVQRVHEMKEIEFKLEEIEVGREEKVEEGIRGFIRSFDLRMPEEHNRRLTDHISGYLFAPTKRAEENLKKENVWGKIFLTGNTAIDAVNQHLPIAEKKSKIMQEIPFKTFVLATAHRAENVDDPAVLESFIEVFSKSPLPIVYPMHPRTKKRLQENNMLSTMEKMKNVLILPPLGYLDFLMLERNCKLIITDSGGIQEEATAPQIRKRVLVIRLSTERQEAIEAGFATVVGTDKNKILEAMKEAVTREEALPETSPFGDGTSGKKTIEIIKKNFA
jgi:UDP-N-acetylglucosamine 2-epimerase (non-hydrolysing)